MYDELVLAALLFLDRSLMKSSRIIPTASEAILKQYSNHVLHARHYMTEIDTSTGNSNVQIHQNEPSRPVSSIAINFQLRSLLALPSSMKMDSALVSFSIPLLQTQPTV